jgi:hypothetical protein
LAKVLIQGVPFLIGPGAVQRYAGPHDIRWMCGLPGSPDQGYHLRYDLTRHTMADVLDMLGHWRPDVVLFFQPEDQAPPRGVEHIPVKTVGIPADWSHTFPRIHGAIGKFDAAAFDYPGVARAHWRGHCQPRYFGPIFTYAPDLHRNLDAGRDIDVLYAGSMNHALRPERGILLPRLEALSGRYRIHLTSGVFGEDYVRLMNRARLVFNYSARGELNLRFWETLACGAIPMVERGNVEVHAEFPQCDALCLFDLDDFEDAIARVLDAPDGGEAMRRRAAAMADHYLPERLLDRFIEHALTVPSIGRAFTRLPLHEQMYIEVMAHSGSPYPAVRAMEGGWLKHFARACPEDPRAWTLMARSLLTPVLHLYLECPDPGPLKPPVRQALEKAAILAPQDAVHQANAAWACRWCGDAAAAARHARRARAAEELAHPELLIGSLEDPAWARYMLACAEGRDPAALHAMLCETLPGS